MVSDALKARDRYGNRFIDEDQLNLLMTGLRGQEMTGISGKDSRTVKQLIRTSFRSNPGEGLNRELVQLLTSDLEHNIETFLSTSTFRDRFTRDEALALFRLGRYLLILNYPALRRELEAARLAKANRDNRGLLEKVKKSSMIRRRQVFGVDRKRVTINVRNGNVVLSGSVRSVRVKESIEGRVSKLVGRANVRSNLWVRPAPQAVGVVRR